MNPYIDKLKAFLSEKKPDYGYSDAHSLLDMLYLFYTELNPIDDQMTRSRFLDLEEYMVKLPLEDQDRVFGILCDIYARQEKLAFFEGLRTGARLILELHGR